VNPGVTYVFDEQSSRLQSMKRSQAIAGSGRNVIAFEQGIGIKLNEINLIFIDGDHPRSYAEGCEIFKSP
jgi:hypothetical protein